MFFNKGVNIHLDVIFKELKVQGFIVTSYKPKFPEGIKQLSHWIEEVTNDFFTFLSSLSIR